jgi:hypothetical protein
MVGHSYDGSALPQHTQRQRRRSQYESRDERSRTFCSSLFGSDCAWLQMLMLLVLTQETRIEDC